MPWRRRVCPGCLLSGFPAFLGSQRPRPHAVAVDAADGVPPHASATLTLGVGYSLVSVVYLIWGGAHYATQFRLKG